AASISAPIPNGSNRPLSSVRDVRHSSSFVRLLCTRFRPVLRCFSSPVRCVARLEEHPLKSGNYPALSCDEGPFAPDNLLKNRKNRRKSSSRRTTPTANAHYTELFAILTKLITDRISDIASRRSERETLGVGDAGVGLDPLSDDPAVPRTLLEDLERLGTAGGEPEMVCNLPCGRERKPIA